MQRFFLLPIIILVTLISACKKDSGIGADILPPSDLLNVKFTDTFTMNVKTVADTFLRTDKLSKNYLGVISNDPLFGTQKASVVMEFDRPSNVPDDTSGPFALDSAVLFLKYDVVYGDTTVQQNFNVRTLTNTVNETQPYYSNSTSIGAGSLVGSLSNYTLHPSDRVHTSTTDTTGVAGVIHVKLSPVVGYSILNLGQNILRDSLQFKNSFPGVLIENPGSNGKAMAEINSASSFTGLSVFYKDKRGTAKTMTLFSNILQVVNGSITGRQNGVNLFSNTLSPNVQNTINSLQLNDSINYILGQGGTTVRISLPTLASIGKVAVNKAAITIVQLQQNTANLNVPQFLLLLKRNENGLMDALSTSDGVGLLDSTRTDGFGNKISVYTFNITQYVQAISKGLETNSDLYIATYRSGGSSGTVNSLNTVVNGALVNFGYMPSRLIFAGPNYSDPNYKMKLNITYTLLK